MSDRSDSLLIDECETLKGEVKDCSVIAGDMKVPLYCTNELPHLLCCRQRGWLIVQVYFCSIEGYTWDIF